MVLQCGSDRFHGVAERITGDDVGGLDQTDSDAKRMADDYAA